MLGQPHDKIEAPVTLKNLAGFLAADRDLDGFLHLGHIEAVTGDLWTIQLHGQHRQPADLLDFDVGSSCYCFEHRTNALAGFE